MVLAEGEEPKDLATEEKSALIGIIVEAIAEALKAIDEGEGGDFAVGATPRLSGLQVSKGAPVQSASSAAGSGGRVTVRYRDDHRATSVFTLSRAVPGGWSRLGGVHVRAASDSYSSLGGRHVKRCPHGAKRTGQGACHLKLKLYGHLRHKDRPGGNQLSFRAVDGKPLAPGRYRLTAVALLHTRRSHPVSTTFTVGG
jgi:hypothetical protein